MSSLRLRLKTADEDGVTFGERFEAPTLAGPPPARVKVVLSRTEWARLGRPEELDVVVSWEAVR
jgi:hypothetical protein